jgi:hypothetical protein
VDEGVGELEPVWWKAASVKHPSCGELGTPRARSGVVYDIVGEAPLVWWTMVDEADPVRWTQRH